MPAFIAITFIIEFRFGTAGERNTQRGLFSGCDAYSKGIVRMRQQMLVAGKAFLIPCLWALYFARLRTLTVTRRHQTISG